MSTGSCKCRNYGTIKTRKDKMNDFFYSWETVTPTSMTA